MKSWVQQFEKSKNRKDYISLNLLNYWKEQNIMNSNNIINTLIIYFKNIKSIDMVFIIKNRKKILNDFPYILRTNVIISKIKKINYNLFFLLYNLSETNEIREELINIYLKNNDIIFDFIIKNKNILPDTIKINNSIDSYNIIFKNNKFYFNNIILDYNKYDIINDNILIIK